MFLINETALELNKWARTSIRLNAKQLSFRFAMILNAAALESNFN